MKQTMTITAMALHPPGVNPIYGENVTHIALANEGAGYFFEITQIGPEKEQQLRLDPGELLMLAGFAQQMLKQPEVSDD